jgi:malonyl-CoA O-methyltransferase
MSSSPFFFKTLPADNSEPVVFLPGWGFSGRIVELIPCLAHHTLIYPRFFLDPDSFILELTSFLAHHNIDRVTMAGWSMGANLALDFAGENPRIITKLHLLAMRSSWPINEITAIRQELHEAPDKFLENFYRKCFLGSRKEYKLFVGKIQDKMIAETDLAVLDAGLDYLAAYNLPEKHIPDLNITISHGEKDIIAPVSKRPCLKNQQTRIIPHSGHMFFLSADFAFTGKNSKKTIRLKFSRAAATYDKYADVQKDIATRLAGLLPAYKFNRILEIGCGTGNFTKLLHDKYPAAEISALDFSAEMVEQAKKKIQSDRVDFLCVDGEKYLTGEEKFDLITSNGALQWFTKPHAAFVRIGKRLALNGLFICSIFGPETLKELQNVFNDMAGSKVQLAATSFLTGEELHKSLIQVFNQVEIRELRLSRRYESLLELLRHLQKTGTSGFQHSGPILTRRMIKETDKRFAAEKGFIVTYQIFMITCR